MWKGARQDKGFAKEYRQEEKKQIKEMLKSEFGAFKNDTTVKEYKKEEIPKEEIKIDWNPTTGEKEEEVIEEQAEPEKKKDSKLKKAFDRLKEQQKKEEQEEEEIIGIKGGG